MKIRLLKKEDEKAWEAYVNNHKNATIYHTLEWKKVLEDSYDTLKSLYLIAYDKEDKGKVIGVFPLFLVDSKLFGRRIESLPLSHYVDTLVNNKDINKKLINFASKLTKEYNTKFLEIRSRIQKNTVLKDTNQNYNTIIVPLNKDTNSVWYKLKKVRRKSIKKAEKCGVIIEERNDINSLKEFYKLLTKVRKKQGVPSYGFKFFENIRKHLFPKGYAKLYLAKLNKTTLFSLITFNYNNKIIAGYGMPNKDKKYSNYHASELAYWKCFEWGCKNGFKEFDFGRCHINQKALIDYKTRFGGLIKETPYYYYLNNINNIPTLDHTGSKFKIVKKVWKIFPTQVTEIISPRIFKHVI